MMDSCEQDALSHESQALDAASPPPHTTIDESSSSPIDLKQVWEGLMFGAFDVLETFCSETRCFIVLRQAPPRKRAQARLYAKKLAMLERALLGTGQKVSAAEFGIAVSTVSFSTRKALEFLGFHSAPGRPPLILVLLAHAARGSAPRIGLETWALRDGKECRIVSVSRPDLSLATRLPPSEYAVTRLLVEGRSHAEIAKQRKKSLRTVANQLASAFHRLRISGRAELLNMVANGADAPRSEFEPLFQRELV